MGKDILSERYGRWMRHNGPAISRVLDGLLGRCPLVVDVGAYKGDFFSCILTLRPGAQVHAFEPIPRRARKLAKAFRSLRGVTVHPVALGQVNGVACLHVAQANTMSSLLSPTPEGLQRHGCRLAEVESMEVPVRRLEEYAESMGAFHGIPLDLLKLDVQGGELQVLEGMGHLLAATRVVVMEMGEQATYQGQALASELDGYVRQRGFVRHGAYAVDNPPLPRTGEDVVYVNQTLR